MNLGKRRDEQPSGDWPRDINGVWNVAWVQRKLQYTCKWTDQYIRGHAAHYMCTYNPNLGFRRHNDWQ